MTDEIAGKPRVPVGELREKVEIWKDAADTFDGKDELSKVKSGNIRKCADELEALIERCDYE